MENDMSHMRLTTLALVTLLSLGACGKSEEPPAAAQSAAANELLSYAPADTPYLLANLEPVPEDVIDAFLTRLQPVFESMQEQLSKARTEMESSQGEYTDESHSRLAYALLQELDGKLNRSGLESMGFDLGAEKVVYGLGAFPVIRLGLSDTEALRATILRVLNNAGITAPEQEFNGVPFWRLSDEDLAEAPAGLYVSILEDHLAIGLFPPMAETELLPAFLGLEMPANSDAQARLAQLNRTHGYTSHGSGILDIRRLADQFIQPDTVAARVMKSTAEFDPATLSQECVTEFHEIIDKAPLMTMGVQELTPSAIAVQYRLETQKTLASQLIGLVSKIPVAEEFSDRVLEFAFGMRFGPVRDFLREKVSAIVADPYQCEHLFDLNDSAVETLAKLDEPMPPFVNNFRGIRVSLDEIMMNPDSIPENASGHLAIHVDKPEMFIGMAQMFLPDLSELAITAGDPPVRLPESLVPMPNIVAYAAMSSDAIGLAVGAGEEEGLPEFLDRDAGPEGTFLSAGYDMAAYLDYTGRFSERYQHDSDVHGDPDSMHARAASDLRDAATTAFREMSDRSYSTLRFTADGFVADNRMTFK
jgi:hypothetical protein